MRSIISYDLNPTLRQVATEIAPLDITSAYITQLIRDMSKLLANEKLGVAIAAPQVGDSAQLFIISGRALSKKDDDNFTPPAKDQVYINPTILKMSRGRKEKHEGCLSVRGLWGMVPRAERLSVRAYDENGVVFTRGASGLLAHIIQHEVDHLKGVLYIDRATTIYEGEHDHEH